MSKPSRKYRTGTGAGCMGLNIKKQKDCPFLSYGDMDEFMCNVNGGEDCDLETCKLKEHGRIIVDWSE